MLEPLPTTLARLVLRTQAEEEALHCVSAGQKGSSRSPNWNQPNGKPIISVGADERGRWLAIWVSGFGCCLLGDPRGPYTGRYFSEGASEADGTKGTRKGPDPAPNHPCLYIHRTFSKKSTRESHRGRYPKHIARGAKCWGSLLHACRLFGLNAVGSLLFIHKSFHEAAAQQHCQGWPAVFEGRELFGFAGSVADRHF